MFYFTPTDFFPKICETVSKAVKKHEKSWDSGQLQLQSTLRRVVSDVQTHPVLTSKITNVNLMQHHSLVPNVVNWVSKYHKSASRYINVNSADVCIIKLPK